MAVDSGRDVLELDGTIVRASRGDLYEIDVVAGSLRRTVMAKRSGRLNQHHIKLVAGDRVRVEVSP